VRALRPIAERHGVTVALVALAGLLAQPHVTSVIIGAKTDQQLADNIAATTLTLTAEDLAALDTASAPSVEYPGWMVAFQTRDPRTPS
jgi:aryl-alcohol dehydrogenase-like predicted oxidoreductase